jgi:hypothetical protein
MKRQNSGTAGNRPFDPLERAGKRAVLDDEVRPGSEVARRPETGDRTITTE